TPTGPFHRVEVQALQPEEAQTLVVLVELEAHAELVADEPAVLKTVLERALLPLEAHRDPADALAVVTRRHRRVLLLERAALMRLVRRLLHHELEARHPFDPEQLRRIAKRGVRGRALELHSVADRKSVV